MRVEIRKSELFLKMLIKMIALYCYLYFSIMIIKRKKILKNSSAEITKKGKNAKVDKIY